MASLDASNTQLTETQTVPAVPQRVNFKKLGKGENAGKNKEAKKLSRGTRNYDSTRARVNGKANTDPTGTVTLAESEVRPMT